MAQKTLKLFPLSEKITQTDILNALKNFSISRVHKGNGEAFVEFDNENDLEALEFTFDANKIPELDYANFEKVQQSFKWDFLSSDSSSIPELKEESKSDDVAINLTEAHPNSLITISDCDEEVLKNLTSSQIKEDIFSTFTSVSRVLKTKNSVIVEIQNPSERNDLQTILPENQIKKLGANSFVDLLAEVDLNFGEHWIQQQKKQSPSAIKQKRQNLEENSQVKTQQMPEQHCLHEEIIPKLNKVTSMETNFLLANEKVDENEKKEIHVIHEHDHQHENSHQQLPEKDNYNGQGFLLEDNSSKQNQLLQEAQEERLQQDRQRREIEEQERLEQDRQRREREEQERLEQDRQRREREEQERLEQDRQRREREEHEQEHSEFLPESALPHINTVQSDSSLKSHNNYTNANAFFWTLILVISAFWISTMI